MIKEVAISTYGEGDEIVERVGRTDEEGNNVERHRTIMSKKLGYSRILDCKENVCDLKQPKISFPCEASDTYGNIFEIPMEPVAVTEFTRNKENLGNVNRTIYPSITASSSGATSSLKSNSSGAILSVLSSPPSLLRFDDMDSYDASKFLAYLPLPPSPHLPPKPLVTDLNILSFATPTTL
ncbi:hypothetical protein ACH5RR_032508 [Cinchona calisaya]|uniref:Uncharacterized protein n=1 Tax=Cinchona calisaya TaxID=153742 RepID=A0ABD2YIB4_9GENT